MLGVHVCVVAVGLLSQQCTKKILANLRRVKPYVLVVLSFLQTDLSEAIICDRKRELLAPARFDFSGRNWISGH